MDNVKKEIVNPYILDDETVGIAGAVQAQHDDNKPYTFYLDPFQLKVWPPKEEDKIPQFTLSKVYRQKDGKNDEKKIQVFGHLEANRLRQAIRYMDMVVELFLIHNIKRWSRYK